MKINKKLLTKASEIAHSWFWISDCPTVIKEATEYLENRGKRPYNTGVIYPKDPNELLPRYVALICHICSERG